MGNSSHSYSTLTGTGIPMERDDRDSPWDSDSDIEDASTEIQAANLLFLGSKHFNPVLALGCEDLQISIPGSRCYRSIDEFQSCVPDLESEGLPPPILSNSQIQRRAKKEGIMREHALKAMSSISRNQVPSQNLLATTSRREGNDEAFYPIPGRRFLPHQLPQHLPRKKKPNVITLMDAYEGPMACLNEARKNRSQIKVWTRDKFGIRGYSVGYLLCFDKHWNLILQDVDEVFQRRRTNAVKINGPEVTISSRTQSTNVKSDIVNFKSGSLLSEYSRHVDVKKEPASTQSQYIRKGTQTGYLVHGPESALEICRIGIRKLMIEGIDKHNKNFESQTSAHSSSSAPNTKSTLRKKQLVILRKAETDFVGNKIVARSRLYEIVQRHLPQSVLMGRFIAFVEPNLRI